MIGHYPAALVLQVRQLSQIANVLAVIAWIVVVLSPWGTRELTEQDVLKIEAAFARIEASLGVRQGQNSMTPLTIARDMPLDDLVVRVYHLELSECRDGRSSRKASSS